MNIVVNTRLLLKNKLEGIGWFTYETLKRITINHPEHNFIFVFDRKFDKEFVFSDNVTPIVAGPPTRHPFLWYQWFEKVIPSILLEYKADLFLSPDGYNSLSTKCKSLIVMHDINFIHRPKDLPFLIRKYFNYYFPRYAAKADRIATVSEYSKKDISANFNIDEQSIDVVYNGANDMFKPLIESEKSLVRKKYTGGSEFFLFVGALHPRKNVSGLINAYNEFRNTIDTDTKLVIVGSKMFKSSDIESSYNNSAFKSDIIFTGRLEPNQLVRVMASALALTFVPFFEGFGIPVVEAFYCNTPVITSNTTSLPEIAGDAALLIDPESVESIKDAMILIYTDKDFRSKLIEKSKVRKQKFNWDKTAESLWDSMSKVIEL